VKGPKSKILAFWKLTNDPLSCGLTTWIDLQYEILDPMVEDFFEKYLTLFQSIFVNPYRASGIRLGMNLNLFANSPDKKIP